MRRIKITKENLDSLLKIASKKIKEGKVIVCPTDTVYGLIAHAGNERAVRRIFKIKKRPKEKPIAIFVGDIEMAKKFAKIGKNQEKFLKKYWPGALTAILYSKNNLCRGIYGKNKTVGIRVPDYKLITDLIDKVAFPLAQSSANISGILTPLKLKEIIEQFRNRKEKPDLILDKGDLPQRLPSTVINLTRKKPKILREGKLKVNYLI